MSAKIIDGKKIAEEIRDELKAEISMLSTKGVVPGLGLILVGDDPASDSYVTAKERACARAGIFSKHDRLPADTTQDELLALVRQMNADAKINGILVQLPLPEQIDEAAVLLAIDPAKDVDGFHPVNIGKMMSGEDVLLPCTPNAIIQLLIRSGVRIDGAHVVVVGRSNIVGKPVANMLLRKMDGANATVTVCHTHSKDLEHHTLQADILIVASGRPDTITGDMVKAGVVVIDVGISRVEDPGCEKGYRLAGDVDFKAVKEKASMITPVPGGVGPMTITMLLYNTVAAAKRANGID